MKTIKIFSIILTSAVLIPAPTYALQMPTNGNDLANMAGINAEAYIVMNVESGQILIDKNSDEQLVPASLTKLVTALVVLDTKPKLSKSVAITKADQIAGACGNGGGCIKASVGTKFTVDGLFHAALLPSANNAANALSRSTGLTPAQFAERMNAKVKELGGTGSYFVEPTGMSNENRTTAHDYARIVYAAFGNPYLRNVAQKNSFYLRSTNNKRYNQTIKNTDKLLSNNDLNILGAKTGYLDYYNFAALLSYRGGPKLAVVVLGEQHMYTAFDETRILAQLARDAQDLISMNNILKKLN